MDLILTALNWTYALVATWYGAAIIGGLLILTFERWDRKREPSENDVRRAADHYQQCYGDDAMAKIGDHLLAASFWSDGRHRKLLKRVARLLQARAGLPGRSNDYEAAP